MALDKLVDSTQLDTDLSSVADAIRAKSGGSSSLAFPSGFVSEIQSISGGGSTVTKTTLWSGNAASSSSTVITLLDDVTNYDFLLVTCGVSGSTNYPYTSVIDTSMWTTGSTKNYYGITALEGTAKYNSISITMRSNTTISFQSFAVGWNAGSLLKVVGVKL